MNNLLICRGPSSARPTNAELTGALRSSLDRKYTDMVQSARRQWERSFPGKDPSDACVSVRITKGKLRDTRPSFRRALSYGL